MCPHASRNDQQTEEVDVLFNPMSFPFHPLVQPIDGVVASARLDLTTDQYQEVLRITQEGRRRKSCRLDLLLIGGFPVTDGFNTVELFIGPSGRSGKRDIKMVEVSLD